MCATNEEFNIPFDDHKDAIRRRIYDAWTTSQIVDSWIEKYPQWRHIERRKFADASLLSNPASKRYSKKWGEIYARTLTNFNEERRALLQATAGKASTAILELVEKVRRDARNISVESARDLLAELQLIGLCATGKCLKMTEKRKDDAPIRELKAYVGCVYPNLFDEYYT